MSEGPTPSPEELDIKAEEVVDNPKKVVPIESHPNFQRYNPETKSKITYVHNLKEFPYQPPPDGTPRRFKSFMDKYLNSRVKDYLSKVNSLPAALYDQAIVAIKYQVEREFNLRDDLGLLARSVAYLNLLKKTALDEPEYIALGVATGLSAISLMANLNIPDNPFQNNPAISKEVAGRLSSILGFAATGASQGTTLKEKLVGAVVGGFYGNKIAEGGNQLTQMLQQHDVPIDSSIVEGTVGLLDDGAGAALNLANKFRTQNSSKDK
jgi:hypothetical protein